MKHGLPSNVKGWWSCEKESLWLFEPFCKFWTLIKIKVSMTCVYKGYQVQIKMVQEQWLQLKMKLLLGYNMKIVI